MWTIYIDRNKEERENEEEDDDDEEAFIVQRKPTWCFYFCAFVAFINYADAQVGIIVLWAKGNILSG